MPQVSESSNERPTPPKFVKCPTLMVEISTPWVGRFCSLNVRHHPNTPMFTKKDDIFTVYIMKKCIIKKKKQCVPPVGHFPKFYEILKITTIG